jgi:hypothetical protein
MFEPIPEKLLTIASGATPIGSTGRAPDDNGQHWLNDQKYHRIIC